MYGGLNTLKFKYVENIKREENKEPGKSNFNENQISYEKHFFFY